MIILATAIIATLSQNGIIGRANEATTSMTEAQIREAAQLVWADISLSSENKDSWTEEDWTDKLTDKLEAAGVDISNITITATKDGVTVEKTSTPPVIEVTTLGELVTSAANYGDTVSYSANGVNDWKVFYKRTVNGEEYVYLITSNYVPRVALPDSITGVSISTEGLIGWNTSLTNISAANIINSDIWMANWSDYNSGINAKRASYIASEEYWTDFINTDYKDYVIGAIGSPTLEMFVESWNAKGEIYNTSAETEYQELKHINSGSTGYIINSQQYGEPINIDDILYVPAPNATGYWLAAPGNTSDNYISVIHVYDNTARIASVTDIASYHVRPVVCFKASTPAYAGTDIDIVLKVDE